MGAGYVGGPTMAVIAARSPDVLVTVVDISQKQIDGTPSISIASRQCLISNYSPLPCLPPSPSMSLFPPTGRTCFR